MVNMNHIMLLIASFWRLQDKERPLAMTTERPACGLASLLSMSCRDRAEAFARSLQMRLQTLGLGHAPDHPLPGDPSTSSSIAPAACNVTPSDALPEGAWASARPPLRLSSSSDSDLYYDFDIDPESPGSPAEDAVEVVVARQPRTDSTTEPESGLTSSHFGTSPDSDSSDSLGPEAFVSPSSSPGWSSAPAAPRRRSPPSSTKCNGHVPSPRQGASLERVNQEILDKNVARRERNAFSEDKDVFMRLESGSLVSAEGYKTHAPENECSFFRTKACDEEQCFVPTRNLNNLVKATGSKSWSGPSTLSMCAPDNSEESYVENVAGSNADNVSQSENLDISNEDEIELLPSDDPSTENHCDKENGEMDELFTSTEDREQFSDYLYGDISRESKEEELGGESSKHFSHEVRDIRSHPTNLPGGDETFPPDQPIQTCHEDEFSDVQSAQAEMGILPRKPSWESDENTVCGRITIIINQEDNLLNGAADRDVINIKVASKTQDNEVLSSIPNFTKSEEPMGHPSENSLEIKTDNSITHALQQKAIENDADEDSPRLRLRRCSSLKTGKTPPGTPSRKKIVRFADVLGLDLADVRTFLDEIPKIPSSAYDDLPDADLSLGSLANPVVASSFPVSSGQESVIPMSLSIIQPCKILMPMFQQPGGQPDFFERIRTKLVCLENAVVKDPAMFSIGGVVRVRNLDYQKSVFIRYSIDSWATFADLQATYVPNSCDGFSDKFSFVLFAHTLSVGQRLEFAVRFQTANGQYWDSNGGANYAFQCLPACNPTPYMEMPNPEDRLGTFY